ncbi:MAG: hypothetical protein K6C35_02530 [Eubacterium sp.]|nr:hypothetical protein [Eubacterium sp.]
MVFLCACGNKEEEKTEEKKIVPPKDYIGSIDKDTLKMNGDGSILEIACDDYSKVDFNISTLESDLKQEIADYNEKNGKTDISFLQYRNDSGVIKVAIKYLNIEAYNKFNGTDYRLEMYSPDAIQKIHMDELEKQAEVIINSKIETLSEGELAEAGISKDDLNDPVRIAEITGASPDAELSDEKGTKVKAKDIENETYMMLITNIDISFDAGNGEVCYVNDHAKIAGKNSAETDGKGFSAIVFTLGID